MEQNDLQRALMAVLFAAGEPVDAKRLSQTLECDETEIHEACKALMDDLSFNRSGIRHRAAGGCLSDVLVAGNGGICNQNARNA